MSAAPAIIRPVSDATVVPPGQGEVLGDAPRRRVELLCACDALHVTITRFGPLQDGADLHVHRRHDDLFYVLEGELSLAVGPEGREIPLAAGTLVRVPPLVVHGFRNATRADVRYLNLHAPGRRFADYMRGLRDGRRVTGYDQEDPPADGGRPAGGVLVAGPVADAPASRVLTDADPIAVSELRATGGDDLEAPAPGPSAVRCVFVLDGAVDAGGRRAPAGAWLELPAGPLAVTAAPDARVLHVAAGA